ncbi:MAG TPA: glycosyltransferase family 4 protein [Gammaproteobacteria bacterium]
MELAARARRSRPSFGSARVRVVVVGLRGVVNMQGGIEMHARMLYPLLARMGCDVEVIQRAPHFRNAARPREWHGVKLKYFWSPTTPGLEAAVHTLLGVLYAAVTRPDILHLHAVGPGLLAPFARMLGLRVIVTHHAEDYRREKWGRLAKSVLKAGEWLGMRFAHRPIVVSEALKRSVAEKYGVDARLIPNGAPPGLRATSRKALEQFGLSAGAYVLCVARIDMTKRQMDLIDAFERAALPAPWKLVLVGAVDRANPYCAAVAERAAAGSRIVLTGLQSGKRLRELYSHCGLFVLPSSMEGHPIALLEALSYGVPVLASAIPENLALPIPRERLFPVGDAAELARLMRAAVEEGAQGSDEARRIVRERYSWRRAARLTWLEYESALGR